MVIKKASAFVSSALVSLITQPARSGLISEDTATKTLVVVDDWATVESHSILFDHIGKGKLGHEIEFAMANTGPQGKVKHHDAYYFDNIVLMSPSIKENDIANDLKVNNLREFLSESEDAKHNLLVFGDTESRRHTRKLANNLGVDFEPYVSTAAAPALAPRSSHTVCVSLSLVVPCS